MLSDEAKAALKATADALSAPGKGFLASDESAGPWLRAGHVEAKKIPDTAENRAACACRDVAAPPGTPARLPPRPPPLQPVKPLTPIFSVRYQHADRRCCTRRRPLGVHLP